jgi:hypothetical protein
VSSRLLLRTGVHTHLLPKCGTNLGQGVATLGLVDHIVLALLLLLMQGALYYVIASKAKGQVQSQDYTYVLVGYFYSSLPEQISTHFLEERRVAAQEWCNLLCNQL